MLPTPNPCPFLKGIDGAGQQQHLLLEGELPEEQMERPCPGGTLTPPATKMSSVVNRMEKMKTNRTRCLRDVTTALDSECSSRDGKSSWGLKENLGLDEFFL